MNKRTTCLVIGGGPAGMMFALLLARTGVDVTVLEKHSDFLRDFRDDTVHPSTLQVLDELGLGERFARLPQSRIERVSLPLGGGRGVVVGDLTKLRVAHPYIAMVPQWDLLNLLAEAAGQEPTFTLRMRTEAVELLRDGDRVRGVRYRDEDGATGEITADLTVGCDGRSSMARDQAGLGSKQFPVPMDVWWFSLSRQPDDESSGLLPVAGDGRMLIVIPREDHHQLGYLAGKGTARTIRERGIDAFREDVARLAPWCADRSRELTSMDQLKLLDVKLDRASRWHTEGLLCTGDAAHAMSPVGGVGINLAIQDAVAAARILAEPLRLGRVSRGTLARVRFRRLVPTIAVQLLQRALHRAVVAPVLQARRVGPPKPLLALLRRFPALNIVPAYLIGVGIRPEHAPAYARRSMATHDR